MHLHLHIWAYTHGHTLFFHSLAERTVHILLRSHLAPGFTFSLPPTALNIKEPSGAFGSCRV